MQFEWDEGKNRTNEAKHGLSFDTAKRLFETHDCLELYDAVHSCEEDRFIAIGEIQRGVIVVIYTEAIEDTIRIISARKATAREARRYRRARTGDSP
jgi:uncharacterized DUF497 family protein